MSAPIENQIAALKAQGEALIAAMEVPDEVHVSFCSCGERWLDPADANAHVAHTYVSKRYTIAPWLPVTEGGAE